MIGRRVFLAIAVGLLPALCAAAPMAAPRPNVVLIMVDDWGYECVGANGGTSYQTPNLDRLAATGVRGEHCYVQPLCTPTRVQLMTGQYNVRNYTHFGHLDPGQTTFAHLFKNAGYKTCIAGKWQLGREMKLPQHFGFERYCCWQLDRRPSRYANPGLEIDGKRVDFTSGEYGPDIVSDYARKFVAEHKDEPFFLYYPMMLTHGPYVATPDSPDWDPKAPGEKAPASEAHFADMVKYADKLIGKLVETLEENKLRERTLLIVIGDNGTGRGTRSKMGERVVIGGKGSGTHRGMHVPLIANWPGTVKSGLVLDDLVDASDFLPTICEAAGIKPPSELPIDGRSFLAALRGESGNPRAWIYCWYASEGGPSAQVEFAMNQKYKLYRDGRMIDLVRDPEEDQPLDAAALSGEAAAAKSLLCKALAQYRDARPAAIAAQAGPAAYRRERANR
jgi:arylsulfatase A